MSPEILLPTAPHPTVTASATYDLGSTVDGIAIGLRLDRSWRSYDTVVDVWDAMLRADGARPVRLITGERVGSEGERTRADLDDWSRLVACGVVGLGN